jgi:hypothetical protein
MNNTKYPTHEEVGKTIRKIADACLDYEYMHNRESLDMLIADLKQYRETIATCREYMDRNLL